MSAANSLGIRECHGIRTMSYMHHIYARRNALVWHIIFYIEV